MIHHRQRLLFGLEPRDHLFGVHPQLDHLERHPPPHRLRLLRDINHATPAFADTFQKFLVPERLAHGFIARVGKLELDRGAGSSGLRSQQCFGLFVRR